MEVVAEYFDVVNTPEEADFALVGIQSPDGGVGYDVFRFRKRRQWIFAYKLAI